MHQHPKENNETETKEEAKEELFKGELKQQPLLKHHDHDEPVEYGLLKDLEGVWVNAHKKPLGLNVISVPAPGSLPDEGGHFVPIVFNYTESLIFKLKGGARNRGGLNEQFIGAVEYSQTVQDTNNKIQHIEDGMFLFLDNTSINPANNKNEAKKYKPDFVYCRSGTVPHGNSLMLFGNEVESINGPPKFNAKSLSPISDTMTGIGYDEVYLNMKETPLQALENAIKDQKIVKTRTIVFSSDNGNSKIIDTPFITKFVNATKVDFILWLETVEDNGKQFLQLQYQQVINLEFGQTKPGKDDSKVIVWPHITVNTMILANN